MDYHILLDMAAELGYRLAMSGAETYRIEESINRVLAAYGLESEVWAIPNCLTVSIETDSGIPMTRMRRVGYHGNDLDAVEKYSNLSRKICSTTPTPQEAMSWIKETTSSCKQYKLPIYLLGNFLGAAGFCVIFGGNITDSLCAGICGLAIGCITKIMDNLKANTFFKTITASFVMAILSYCLSMIGFAYNVDAVNIGALMILVPGLIFTNAMRDIIYGDTNSGINRIVQVFLIAAAIALGTAAAWNVANMLWNMTPNNTTAALPFLVQCIACFVGCLGFTILFNIHGPGGLLCALGGMLTWLIYTAIVHWGAGDITAYFGATIFASAYAELMARIRKYPTISYLVVSAFPLIPGAGVYYTMRHAVEGDMAAFSSRGMHTVAIAGVMAVGILLVSTIVRMLTGRAYHKLKK